MAFPALPRLALFICFAIYLCSAPCVRSQIDETSLKLLMTDALEFSTTTMSVFDQLDGDEVDGIEGGFDRRSLYWRRPYYISYGALSANRIPCPARSGRSYYTHNCFKARGPVHPYTRGCSAITRCRR
ncbi:Rapid ALkalinization Factor [Quillaja saponaria]|uniref:Rapid ALkalinization Factor n=1 Tax=Quillaja saponaria TaxID=32244 RepID=A0AAD7P7A9_QUISA|nr:Rapid ALkalinization Factor [Quillaja saponaria]